MGERTARHNLSLLVPGQGQKDVTMNEALLALDRLLQPVAVSRAVAVPPAEPADGACWLVPDGAGGDWAGQAGLLACWSAGGWRFHWLPEGATLWIADEGRRVRVTAAGLVSDGLAGLPAAAVPAPAGGATVDIEARAAISVLLDRLVSVGLLAS